MINTEKKNNILSTLADLLEENYKKIIIANQQDLEYCRKNSIISESLLDRLVIDKKKILGMVESINKAISLDDPVGKVINKHVHENGMVIENKTVGFGKVLIIYESRPDVTIEASIIAFKSGNRVYLKGGSEAKNSNLELINLWRQALNNHGIDKEYIQYLNLNREQTSKLIRENHDSFDLIIPRGGKSLIDFITKESSIPLLVSGRGNNFIYVDKDYNLNMAIDIILNGKQRISVCNALDKVLFHQNISNENLIQIITKLLEKKIEVILDEKITQRLNDFIKKNSIKTEQKEEIWHREFLSATIFLSIVNDEVEAIKKINKYSGGHSCGIISNNKKIGSTFQNSVDAAAVYHNCSLRFTDGGQFGFSAEIAVSTQKLHSRGPIGLEQLVTNKWFINGNGQIRN